MYILSLGDLFGFGDIELGIFNIPLLYLCYCRHVNAFNMIDGINGLCSGSAMLSLLFIGFIQV